ncbi:SDR family oxidoreductase [Gordonia sp. L191]|uniref:SDR family NAD(P)-dependent oxidoreductase n=1 Tax=Gordonia sp. L191 TaxID=2982699 RepID=UPI0024BFB1F7|nr:SDR family oxidoreductase [Gordonia sp. L191]WHU47386.1 SDR family oxidoreductase [Gordonia sp. L191]
MTSYDLSGRIALVTGAAQGLGAGMASALAAAGASVAVADINTDLGQETADNLRAAGAKAEFVHLDVRQESDWETAVTSVVGALGGLDIVVNNAGIEITELLVDFDPRAASDLLAINVLGTALGIKHAFRAMRPGGPAGVGGAVVNIASVAATIAFPGISLYSASKSAIDRLTRVAAAESGKLGYGVRVNCIYPGLTPTAMGNKLAVETAGLGLFESPEAAAGAVAELTPLGRLGQIDDMADAVVFLASDAAKFITGAGLPVDGGMGM